MNTYHVADSDTLQTSNGAKLSLIAEITNLDYPVRLYRAKGRKDRFVVQYGLQVTDYLTREQAAKEFGECVFHSPFVQDG